VTQLIDAFNIAYDVREAARSGSYLGLGMLVTIVAAVLTARPGHRTATPHPCSPGRERYGNAGDVAPGGRSRR
jgi:hypothetical protein